ncbi:MlaD family protein [Nocardia fluminea]|uniref:Phospholipid/cholesterol/gamma-HCH transport system substrate-binding protein n=1 Tax=Nocardia fluminea TaxID=134984 RepID=A0A2N3VK66_9NOCA|nr:MlaD family protein [Nocardia fluminea]PKV82009.1 phospholipid/cholesterol/gamma-HCH transport system substrate-binding protein [Nocardia fluminea]
MKSATPLVIRLAVFTAAMLLLLAGVFQALSRPVDDTVSYTAEFTDANGLRSGNDVRLFGVRVGTVKSVELHEARAVVTFDMEQGHPMYANNILAIRFLNLTGQRYLDVQQVDVPAGNVDPGSTIGIEHTVPAFDITTLFNGLQPVLAELTPADLNHFATSLLAVIEGDGTGLGPALDAIETLSKYTTDRQETLSTLVRNLATVAHEIGGRSGNAMVMVSRLTDIFVTLQERIGGLIDFSLTIPPVLRPATSMLTTLGFTGNPNPDIDTLIRTAIPDQRQAVDTMNQVPALLQTLADLIPPTGNGAGSTCTNGAAQAPQPLQVLISGQRITLCNR